MPLPPFGGGTFFLRMSCLRGSNVLPSKVECTAFTNLVYRQYTISVFDIRRLLQGLSNDSDAEGVGLRLIDGVLLQDAGTTGGVA